MTLRYLLWDFGDTLVDQDWMLQAPEGYSGWPRAWTEVARGDDEEAWYRNEVTCEQIAQGVSDSLGMPLASVMKHIQHCCTKVDFFEACMKAVRDSKLPQAIVTVNPDVFTRFVVPHYRLDELFPVIVTSWEEGTVDKATLCARALERLGGRKNEEALLIDNNEEAVQGWKQAGGQGYLYRGEARFVADLESSLCEIMGDDRA